MRLRFLSGNMLNGTLPDTYNCTYMQILDFSNNFLSGTIPLALFTAMTFLDKLDLSSNSLSGTISSSLSSSSLIFLDLSSNELSGILPNTFGNQFTRLQYLYNLHQFVIYKHQIPLRQRILRNSSYHS